MALKSAGIALLVLALAGCDRAEPGPVRVVVIGDPPRVVDASLGLLRPADAVLTGAVAEGIVRLDAAGQIVPGLAERWSLSDDGLSYIFRLGRRTWPDGTRVTARFVVRRLRAAARADGRNPLSIVLTGIKEIVATTDEVFEIRLRAPRPNLLTHLARPELGIVQSGRGAGPFTAAADADADADDDENESAGDVVLTRAITVGEDSVQQTLRLRAARAALALALFDDGQGDVVLGGTFADVPVLRAARLPAAAIRFDPAQGLFGLAIVETDGALGLPEVRHALSMAIDRDAIVQAVDAPDPGPRTTLTPPDLSNLRQPALPYWALASLAARRAEARRLLATVETPLSLRVALPEGPGSRLLFAHLARDWAAVGVTATRVALRADADLRLVDAVAPSRGASWYLERFACARSPVCDPAADAALGGSRLAANPIERAAYFAAADRALTDAAIFVPLASPVRWSLVARRVTGFRTNALAVHSLTDIRR